MAGAGPLSGGLLVSSFGRELVAQCKGTAGATHPKEDHEKACTLHPNTPFPFINPILRLRPGAVKYNWTKEAMNDTWEKHKYEWQQEHTQFDHTNRDHLQDLNIMAHFRLF